MIASAQSQKGERNTILSAKVWPESEKSVSVCTYVSVLQKCVQCYYRKMARRPMWNENKDYLNFVNIIQFDISCTIKKTSSFIVEVIKTHEYMPEHSHAQIENITHTIITLYT